MRYYKVKGIKHTVYEHKQEVPPHIDVITNWRMGNIGDWVLADDRCIIQILRKGAMLRKNGNRAYVGTCTGTFLVLQNTFMNTDRRTNIYSFGGEGRRADMVRRERVLRVDWSLLL